jgi:hypothetical protein
VSTVFSTDIFPLMEKLQGKEKRYPTRINIEVSLEKGKTIKDLEDLEDVLVHWNCKIDFGSMEVFNIKDRKLRKFIRTIKLVKQKEEESRKLGKNIELMGLIDWLDTPDKEPIIDSDEEAMLESLRKMLNERVKTKGWQYIRVYADEKGATITKEEIEKLYEEG